MKNKKLAMLTLAIICCFQLFINAHYTSASSVLEVSVNEMVQNCKLVFEGKVTAVESRETRPGLIHTHVSFEIIDVIKGSYNIGIITLRFLGGTVGDTTLAVSDMRLPQVGEHGIYFVESPERMQANPLYGWSQGHFVVERDAEDVERVFTNTRRPVLNVRVETTAEKQRTGNLSQGVARDIVVAKDADREMAIGLTEFKKVLLERIGKGQ